MTQLKNKTLLITGGASGIGKILGDLALEKGAQKVIVWDVDEKNFDQLMERGQTLCMQVDVSDAASVDKAAASLLEAGLTPDVLVLNAGVVTGRFFHDHSHAEIDKTIGVNVLGVMRPARAFLPAMIARGSGHLVVISSAAGMLANPRMAVYAASKWAVYGWAESVRLEMEQLKTGVKVTTVTPSYINTGMFAGARVNLLIPNLSPEKAARKIIRGIERNRVFVRMPALVYLIPLLKGLMPVRLFDLVAGKWLRVYKSMDAFTGRPD